MYIIFSSIFFILVAFFWQTLYTIITGYMKYSSKSLNSIIGNLWFICLLIINIIIIIFIYVFYYYKSTEKGLDGNKGSQGFDGQQGDPCYIKTNKCNT